MTIAIRGPRPTDQAFIANSWASSLAGPRSRWGEEAHAINATIDRLLDDPRTRLLVACDASDTDRIIGWVAYARIPGARVLEFVHVRRERRNEGITERLLADANLTGPGARLTCLYPPHSQALNAVHIPPEEFLT